MSAPTRSYSEDDAYLRAVSAFKRIGNQLDSIESRLRAGKSWLPSRELLAELSWSREKIGGLEASWAHKLVVALVGPSGAGKSTLLNALAGRELSVTGRERPTTREVIIYSQSLADTEGLVRHCGVDSVQVVIDYQAAALEYLTLVDAPDTNTMPENQALLARVLEKTDAVVAVFPATNPKMHDNIAFLRPFIQRFPKGAVIPVLNKVDRVPKTELEGEVVPDFRETIAREWGLASASPFLTSARSSAQGPRYPEDEKPLHDIDETSELRRSLRDYVGSMGQVVDRRLARAEQLVALVRAHSLEALEQTAQERAEARVQLSRFAKETTKVLIDEFQRIGERETKSAPGVALYSELSPRWWGPLGWIVGIWSALLSLGSAVGRFFRRGVPMKLPFPVGGRLGTAGLEAEVASSSGDGSRAGSLSFVLRSLYASEWPPVADALVTARFDVAVRDSTHWETWAAGYQEEIVSRWRDAFRERVHFLTRHLSLWPLQVLLNAPTLVLSGWVCVETLRSFLAQEYLSADYFRQAFIVVALVWALSFVVLQMLISAFSGRRFYRALSRELASSGIELATEWERELEALEILHAFCQVPSSSLTYPEFWARHFPR